MGAQSGMKVSYDFRRFNRAKVAARMLAIVPIILIESIDLILARK